MKLTLAPNEFLDEYILGCEFAKLANISSNAYLFWKDVISAKFERSRIVFLHSKTIPSKFQRAAKECQDLKGLVLASSFCSFTGIAPSHLVQKNGSSLYKLFELKEICGVKFINLKKFYDDLGLDYEYRIYIEKCKFFSPEPLEKRIRLTDTLCLGYY